MWDWKLELEILGDLSKEISEKSGSGISCVFFFFFLSFLLLILKM